MSFPSCVHGWSDPMFTCPQCQAEQKSDADHQKYIEDQQASEQEMERLNEENSSLKADLAAAREEANDLARRFDQSLRENAALAARADAAEEQSPYWLLRGLAADREAEDCANGTDTSCDQTSMCVTEYCHPCAARAWMNQQRELERPAIDAARERIGG